MDNCTSEFFYGMYQNFLLKRLDREIQLMRNMRDEYKGENYKEALTLEFWQKDAMVERHAWNEFVEMVNNKFYISARIFQQLVVLRHKNLSQEFLEAEDRIDEEIKKIREEFSLKRAKEEQERLEKIQKRGQCFV